MEVSPALGCKIFVGSGNSMSSILPRQAASNREMHVLALRRQFLEITELFPDDIGHSNINDRNGNIFF